MKINAGICLRISSEVHVNNFAGIPPEIPGGIHLEISSGCPSGILPNFSSEIPPAFPLRVTLRISPWTHQKIKYKYFLKNSTRFF